MCENPFKGIYIIWSILVDQYGSRKFVQNSLHNKCKNKITEIFFVEFSIHVFK